MNDFFSVLDEFEFEEFVAPEGEGSSSFSLDTADDASGLEYNDELVDNVVAKEDVTKTDGSQYVWKDNTNPFTGTTTGVWLGFVEARIVEKTDGGKNGNLTYKEVSLAAVDGISFSQTIREAVEGLFQIAATGIDMALGGSAGTNVNLSNGVVKGGTISGGSGFITLWNNYTSHNADNWNSDDEKTTVTTSGFGTDVVFTATDNDLETITTDEAADGKVTVNGDYKFTLDGNAINIKNVDTANPGDIVLTYDSQGNLALDASDLTVDADYDYIEIKNAQGVTEIVPPDAAQAAEIKIGKSVYTYTSVAGGDDAYFITGGAQVPVVSGFVLADVGDSITVESNKALAIYDQDDTNQVLINVSSGANYTVTKLKYGYKATFDESATVTVPNADDGDSTFTFNISKATKANADFAGVSIYFDEDGTIKGVQGINQFTADDSLTVSGPAASSEETGVPFILSTTAVADGRVTAADVAGYIAVKSGDFTVDGDDNVFVSEGETVYSISAVDDGAGDGQIIVGSTGGTVTDGEGNPHTYASPTGKGYFLMLDDEIVGFNFAGIDDSITLSTDEDEIALFYDRTAIAAPDVTDSDESYTVTMAKDGEFTIGDLEADAVVEEIADDQDKFTFDAADGTATFDEDGKITEVGNFEGKAELTENDDGLIVNGEELDFNFADDDQVATLTAADGVSTITGLQDNDSVGAYVEGTDQEEDGTAVFQFATDPDDPGAYKVNGKTYTVTGDQNGIVNISADGKVTDLDVEAKLAVDPAAPVTVNGADFTASEVDGEEIYGYEKKNGDTSAYVTDAAHPLVTNATTEDEMREFLGLPTYSDDNTYYESTAVGSKDLSESVGAAQYFFNTSNQDEDSNYDYVKFNDAGKNFAYVSPDAEGDKLIMLGNKGDAVVMDGNDADSTVSIIGGTGNDTIVVRDNSVDRRTAVYEGTTETYIDLSSGGADKVITYAEANANIVLDNYDETSKAGVVFHDPEMPYIKQDITGAIEDGLLTFENGSIVAIDRGEDDTGIDNKTKVTVKNLTTAHQNMVRLFGYKDSSDGYSDDFGQLVGFTGSTGGLLNASDLSEDVVLVGNYDGKKSAGSYLVGGGYNDTIFGGGLDSIDAGDGKNLIVLDADEDGLRDEATIYLGSKGYTTIKNFDEGFDGDKLDITPFGGKTVLSLDEDGDLTIADSELKSATLVEDVGTDLGYTMVNLVDNGETLKAAVAAEDGMIYVDDDDTPNYYAASEGGITFIDYSGDVGIDVDGIDTDWGTSYVGTEQVTLNGGVNTLIGGSGTTIFKGGAGDETLIAGTGESSLYGGGGKNVLSNTAAEKVGSTEFFVIGIHNGAQNTIEGFEFVKDGGTNSATFDNLNIGMTDGNEVTDVKVANGNVEIAVKGQESGAVEKATIVGAAGKEMLVDRGTDSETVAQIAASVVTVNNSYVDFYLASEKNASVQIGDVQSAKVWLESPEYSDGVEFVGEFAVISALGSEAKVEMAGNDAANTIIGGLGNASMWGGSGSANDLMIGGSAHNEYYYEVGNGNDTIVGSLDGDIIHLGMTLDQIDFDGTTMDSSGIVVKFNDGGSGSLTITGNTEVSFSFDDNTTVKANRETQQFE